MCVFVAKIGTTVFRDFPSEAWKPKSTIFAEYRYCISLCDLRRYSY